MIHAIFSIQVSFTVLLSHEEDLWLSILDIRLRFSGTMSTNNIYESYNMIHHIICYTEGRFVGIGDLS